MRYSIMDATVQQVKGIGALNIKEASRIGIIFAELTEAQAAKLKAVGCRVNKVGGVKATVSPPVIAPPSPVAAIPTYSAEELVWAAGLEDLRSVTEPPLYGEGFTLAIIGTGIRETHDKISGRVVYRKNYTSDPMEDGFDHDTGVCSIALAVAPKCNILNMKVLDNEGKGSEEDVALAIDDCITLQDTNPSIAPHVINLSLGGPDEANPNDPLRVACRAATERGVWVAASAGNSGPAPYTVTCPACERYVMAVGSAKFLREESAFVLSEWSSRGPTPEGLTKPDIVMFGEDISMASSASDTATVAKSGTSFAAPFISSIGVLYHEGCYRIVTYPGDIPPGIIMAGQGLVAIDDIIDNYLPNMCIKPGGVVLAKDNAYGSGLLWGPLMYQAITVRPLLDISVMITPIIVIGMLGMMMGPMTKGLK